jgi:quinol monooxygenase YgiN
MDKAIVKSLGAIGLLAASTLAVPAVAEVASGIRYGAIAEGAYSIFAEVQAQPGKEAALREETLPLVALVRGDPKNLVYFLQEDRAMPGHFIFYEVFATKEDFEAHNAMPYVKDWLAKLPSLAVGGVRVLRMEVLGQRPANPGRAPSRRLAQPRCEPPRSSATNQPGSSDCRCRCWRSGDQYYFRLDTGVRS